ncbi:hypothetical protein JW752_05270 [Candidatus Peregrinibacteria bacterium]|nr:hypothetical protein [Candidatus Peregrinibacteria bacterium]
MPRLRSFIIVLAGLLALTSVGYAADDQVEITGTAYGKLINLIHFDYKTATRPTGTADDSRFDDPSFYVGPTKQFYIPVADPDFSAGDPSIVASISTLTDDCDTDGCKLQGFIWSDVIGWIVLDGTIINNAITDPDDGGVGDKYPPDMYPRIKDTGTLTGFAWNEVTGWIKLAANDNAGTITLPENQSNADWGVWLDIEANEIINDNGTPAVPDDDIRMGRPFHGYAWSETMGWIKFFKEASDTSDFDFGVYTTWIPDDTPPKILSPSTVWFATGVNTGYIPGENQPEHIIWNHFMEDMESGLKSTLEGSEVSVAAVAEPGNNICAAHAPLPQNVVISTSSATQYKIADLTIPMVGNLQDVPKGFCKYRLNAKVLNGVNLPTYIGDTFLPPCDTYGDAAACNADSDCSWTGAVCDFKTPPNVRDEIIIYVRAGHFDDTESHISLAGGDSQAIADGTDFVKYEVALRDLVGNPIIPIDCSTPDDPPGTNPQYQYDGCPGREVTVTGNFTNELLFDLTQPAPPAPYLTPARYSDAGVAASGIGLLDSDASFEIFKPDNLYNYQVELASYAPSRTFTQVSDYQVPLDLDFRIDSFEYLIDNDELPATHLIEVPPDSGTFIPDPASVTNACAEPGPPNCTHAFNSGFDLGAMPACDLSVPPNCNNYGFAVNPLNFSSPVATSNPEVTSDSGETLEVLNLSVPANVSFAINNVSANSLAVGDGGLSIDHVFQYYSPTRNSTLAMMETQRILPLSDPEAPDEYLAWSSPFQTCSYCTRYEWFDGEHSALSGLSDQDAEDSVFHSFYQQFNPIYPPDTEPAKFMFDFDVPTDITAHGYYEIIGREPVPYQHTYIGPLPPDPGEDRDNPAFWDENGLIDRSDSADLGLSAGTPATPASISKEIKFTPEQFMGGIKINDIELRLIQEIGYRFGNQPVFSVFAQSPLISGLKVRDVGLEAVGPVIGEELVTGRKFDVISRTDNLDLQKIIRYNAVQMKSSIDAPCPANGVTFTFEETDCVYHDTVNDTKFAYYYGAPGDLLTIGDGTDLAAPSMPYTLIVEGGADVLIRSNLYYTPGEPRASVGIIVIAENIGQGADVYISPAITNMVGTLYAEGSVMSGAPGTVFYGGGTGNVQDLRNQLYWRGSLASRNTIGGTGQDPVRIPDGITCEPGDTDLSCAQRYDFDYMRRFTAVVDGGASSIVGGGLFSGGGCCGTGCAPPIAEGTCQYGTLPTSVILTGTQINEAESELAVFFVEPDPRTLSYPPPGFTVPKSFEFIQEIR